MADRETGRSRGFGFVTFVDHRAMEDAITDMHGRELDGRVISVNKAKPKLGGGDDAGFEHGRGDYGRRGGGDRSSGSTDCFKCGRPGHFARECPMSDGSGGGARFSSQFGRGDRVRIDPYDDRISRGGRYGDRDRVDGRDGRYESLDRYPVADRYNGAADRYGPGPGSGPGRESYVADRYVEREFPSDYGRDTQRGYIREVAPRPGGPDRFERGSYRDRAGPYDRPRRGENLSSYDRY